MAAAAAGHTITAETEEYIRNRLQHILDEYARLPDVNGGVPRDTYEAYLGFMTKFIPAGIRPASPKSRSIGKFSNISRSLGRGTVRAIIRMVETRGTTFYNIVDIWHVGESILRELEARNRCAVTSSSTIELYRRGISILRHLYDELFASIGNILRDPDTRHENITHPVLILDALDHNMKDSSRRDLRNMKLLLSDIKSVRMPVKKSCTIMGGYSSKKSNAHFRTKRQTRRRNARL